MRDLRRGIPITLLVIYLTVLAFAVAARAAPMPRGWHAPPTSHQLTQAQSQLRDHTYWTDPCLAHIIDHEDGTWNPTISYGGYHNVNDSYGLGQANPGTKMARYGSDWATNPQTQLRWARAYAAKYGGECGAWAFWQTHRYW